MKDSELIEHLINGYSLHTVMVPDPFFPKNRPEHLESYSLNNVVINGKYFWGMSGGGHFFCQGNQFGNSRFYYSNINRIFFTTDSNATLAVMMDKCRYKEHNWQIKGDYELLWKWSGERNNQRLKDAINQSRKLKIAILDSEGIWNIHDVELCYYSIEDDTFSLTTSYLSYPVICRYPDIFIQQVEQTGIKSYLEEETVSDSGHAISMALEGQPFIAAMHIYDNGTFKSAYDQLNQRDGQAYKDLRIFAAKQTCDIRSLKKPSYDHSEREKFFLNNQKHS
ncbi:MAG: hypothetical protein EBE86_035090 [Hormoscilla sp. GUM202]|nr:hypothetical protein [Hormoscilla sp. GUM202]